MSVVVPNLNEAKHLPMFLNSLVAQSFKDFEVVIVDGGSKDGSIDIINSFRDRLNIKVVVDKTRNFGHVRNVGARQAEGRIMFQGNSDTYFEPELLQKLWDFYDEHYETIAVAGRVYPLGTSIVAKLAYPAFDFFRFAFTCWPMPIRKFRPSGSFTSCRKWIFDRVGGYPEVTVNEDGLFGQRLDLYASRLHRAVVYSLRLWVGHHVKKFEKMGGVTAFLFYLYTLGNFAPMLKRFLKPIEREAGLVFEGKATRKVGFKVLLLGFWEWL